MTPHFSLAELTASVTAKAKKIDNSPDSVALGNLKSLAQDILEPLRAAFGAPLLVTSGFRSEALNRAISGSSPTSQHCKGEAADLVVAYPLQGESRRDANRRLFEVAKALVESGQIKVGQLIDEYDFAWVHISLPRANKPNNQILHLK